jgi:hypothetical protein
MPGGIVNVAFVPTILTPGPAESENLPPQCGTIMLDVAIPVTIIRNCES